MKTFTLSFVLFFFSLSCFAFESTVLQLSCNNMGAFSKPNGLHASYAEYQSIKVQMYVQKPSDIQELSLYVDGRFVKKQKPYYTSHLFGTIEDKLASPKCGEHLIKVIVKDKCGKHKTVETKIRVLCDGHGNYVCGESKVIPTRNSRFKYLSNVTIGINPKKRTDIKRIQYFFNGHSLGNYYPNQTKLQLIHFTKKPASNPFNPPSLSATDQYVMLNPGIHHIKIIATTNCGTVKTFQTSFEVYSTGSNQQKPIQRPIRYCVSDSWFKYPANNARIKKGSPLYVRVDTKKHQDISYMELYVDGRLLRRENSYPFEWSRPNSTSDALLKRLRYGRRELKVKVVDKCGKVKYIKRSVYIDCR